MYFILFLYFEIWCNTYMLAYIQCESVFNTGVLLQASYCWVWGCVITWVAYCGRKEEEHRTWQAEAAREFGVWISESLSFLETVYLFNIRPKVKGNNPCLFWFVCLKYFYFSLLFYSRLSESSGVRTVRDIHLSRKVTSLKTFVVNLSWIRSELNASCFFKGLCWTGLVVCQGLFEIRSSEVVPWVISILPHYRRKNVSGFIFVTRWLWAITFNSSSD